MRRSELSDAWAAFDASDFEAAINAARPFLGVADSKLSREARKLAALAEFQQENYAEAMVLFQGLASVSADAADWFNVITAATLADEIPTAEHALAIAIQCQDASVHTQQPSVHHMRYFFGCALYDRGELDKAFRQLEELRAVYERLEATEDKFLDSMAVPSLAQFMTLALEVLEQLRGTVDGEAWLRSFANCLDQKGREYLLSLTTRFQD